MLTELPTPDFPSLKDLESMAPAPIFAIHFPPQSGAHFTIVFLTKSATVMSNQEQIELGDRHASNAKEIPSFIEGGIVYGNRPDYGTAQACEEYIEGGLVYPLESLKESMRRQQEFTLNAIMADLGPEVLADFGKHVNVFGSSVYSAYSAAKVEATLRRHLGLPYSSSLIPE